ncbi:AAA family ATPase [Cyanobium sp. WKJ7-Wakatipu]|uniref:AAA family ATPase n=1 Tax=Cyanobium sp. WKJ7-Wakatipu TaxID=2823726 RepID=UPI0020CFADD9|nr:AAA family ATPase [Cyanobium sp. WKJ7-Wakatipu]MCP9783190.1 AAA family ATPase [Cyanobium sp. WKJ7-Wakatipu]
MRRVKTDKLFYGEVLVDRQVWVYATLSHLNEKRKSDHENEFQHNQRIILQITSWRFLITLLGESISEHTGYQDFSWGEIQTISSSKDWVTINLKDKMVFSIKQDKPDLSSIKLWALSEAIKTEEKNCRNLGDAWEQSRPIDLRCETTVPSEGDWTLLLRSYGLTLKYGEKPKRLEWNNKLSIAVISRAFSKKYLVTSSDGKQLEQTIETASYTHNTARRDRETKSTNSTEEIHPCNKDETIKTEVKEGEQTSKSHKATIPKSYKVSSTNRQTNPGLKSQDYALIVQEIANKLEGIVGQEDAKKQVHAIVRNVVIKLENPEKSWKTEKDHSCNIIFSGNPGTGRSSISRILAEGFRKLGILSKGETIKTDFSELIGTTTEETALKTKTIIESSRGNALFIERICLLSQEGKDTKKDQEKINAMLTTVDQNREDIAIFAAGNTEDIRELINSNGQINKIFRGKLYFADYTPGEMKRIFHEMAHADKFTVHGICDANLDEIFKNISSASGKSFENAREVKKIYEQVLQIQQRRISSLTSIMPLDTEEDEGLAVILPCDLPSPKSMQRIEYAESAERAPAQKGKTDINAMPDQNEPHKIKEIIIKEIKYHRAVLASQRRWKGEVDRNGKIINMEKWIREGVYPFLINSISIMVKQESGCEFFEAEAPYFLMSNGARYIVTLERLASEIERIVGNDA